MRIRFRHLFLAGGSAAVVAALYLTDPDGGLSTGMLLLGLVAPLVAVAFAHLARKALHDYPEADARRLFARAGEHPIGAGLALVALALVISALLGLFGRAARAEGVPQAAYQYLPTLRAELAEHWPAAPLPAYVAGLIDHESACPRPSSCWRPSARLKSAREEGAGLGQITRAWRPDGSLRFDALAEMRERHPALAAWSWDNVYQRPELQLRAVVLMSRELYGALAMVSDPTERLRMADAAYNGGLAGLQRERRACGQTPGCDPQRWLGHVAEQCLKSRAALYGQRSACDINRHHVHDVVDVRTPRYAALLP